MSPRHRLSSSLSTFFRRATNKAVVVLKRAREEAEEERGPKPLPTDGEGNVSLDLDAVRAQVKTYEHEIDHLLVEVRRPTGDDQTNGDPHWMPTRQGGRGGGVA